MAAGEDEYSSGETVVTPWREHSAGREATGRVPDRGRGGDTGGSMLCGVLHYQRGVSFR